MLPVIIVVLAVAAVRTGVVVVAIDVAARVARAARGNGQHVPLMGAEDAQHGAQVDCCGRRCHDTR